MMGIRQPDRADRADTSGINALLFGIAATERRPVLTTQVSRTPRGARGRLGAAHHARRGACGSLPKGLNDALMTVHDKRPVPDTPPRSPPPRAGA